MDVKVAGHIVPCANGTVRADNDSPYWQAEFEIVDVYYFNLFQLKRAITLTLYDTDFSLIIDTRSYSRNTIDPITQKLIEKITITALSPVARFNRNHSSGVTITWPYDEQAKQIVQDLIGAVTWNTLHWVVPANSFAATNQAPLEAARALVAEIGAVIVSDKVGNVHVRPEIPKPIPLWEQLSVQHQIDDTQVYESSLSVTARPYFNQLRVYTGEDSFQDKLEWIPDEVEGLKGVMRGYPSPWRTVSLVSSHNLMFIIPLGEVVREEVQERVEFKAGRATLSYPPESLRLIEWINTDLGGVSFAGAELTANVEDGYSLATVTYRVRAFEWSVVSFVNPVTAQFILQG